MNDDPRPKPEFSVTYDPPFGAYLVRIVGATQIQEHILHKVVEGMLASDALKPALYDLGAGNSIAFELGSIVQKFTLLQLEDTRYVCAVLQEDFSRRWQVVAARTA